MLLLHVEETKLVVSISQRSFCDKQEVRIFVKLALSHVCLEGRCLSEQISFQVIDPHSVVSVEQQVAVAVRKLK